MNMRWKRDCAGDECVVSINQRESLMLARVSRMLAAVVVAGAAVSALDVAAVLAQQGAPATAPGASPAGAETGPVSEAIGENIVRFFPSMASRAEVLPSFALERPRPAIGEAPGGFATKPIFGMNNGKQTVTINVDEGTSLYGTGMVAGPLKRNGRTIVCWNTDAYGYGDDAPSLYQSHPWVMGVRADGTAFGVLADTTYRCEVDTTTDIKFTADGPAYAVIVIERGSPQEVVKALADLTGKIEMPPRWALGYHQCRYSYYPDTRVLEIARLFREKQIPCDVLWMDIDYMNGFRCFTFDPKLFPDPMGMNRRLQFSGFSTVYMINPGIKAETNYFVFDKGTEGDHWVKRKDGQTYQGEVWPGFCVFPDYTRRDTRIWWAGMYLDWIKNNRIDGVWNDMNEPAVFNVQSKTMPEDNQHRPDPEFAAANGNNPGDHARFHNVYGMLMVKATREGFMAAEGGKRPFVLSRANYIGGHRYGAIWTGDNTADWYHLESSVPMVLNLGLSGQPFSGPDIGGFAGNGPAGEEGKHFGRWMGIGAMLPFARGHTGKGNIDKEPWSFGPEVEEISRRAIQRRYRLLPYIYTLFKEASETGMPVARPLFFVDAKDPALRSEDDAFLLGGDLMVVTQPTPDKSRTPILPKVGGWRKFDFPVHRAAKQAIPSLAMPETVNLPPMPETPDRPKSGIFEGDTRDPLGPYSPDWPRDSSDELGKELPEIYIRAGAIIPAGPVNQHTNMPINPLTLIVHLDENGKASGRHYSDPGDGWTFREGFFRDAVWSAERNGDTVTVSHTIVGGVIPTPDRVVVVRLLLPDREIVVQGRETQPIVVKIE
jgi:alpha-glucosidase